MAIYSEERGRLGTLSITFGETATTDVYRPPLGGKKGVLFSIQTSKDLTVAVVELDEHGKAVQFEPDIEILATAGSQKINIDRPFFGGYLSVTNDDGAATATVVVDVAEKG